MEPSKLNPLLSSTLRCGEDELEYLQTLSDEQQQLLVNQLKNARVIQHDHVKNAAIDAINHLPRLLSKPLLKMFESWS